MKAMMNIENSMVFYGTQIINEPMEKPLFDFSHKQKRLLEVQNKIVMLIKSFEDGLHISRVIGEYCKKYNEMLDLVSIGFSNIYDLIYSVRPSLKIIDKSRKKAESTLKNFGDNINVYQNEMYKETNNSISKSSEKIYEDYAKSLLQVEENLIVVYKQPLQSPNISFFQNLIIALVAYHTGYWNNSNVIDDDLVHLESNCDAKEKMEKIVEICDERKIFLETKIFENEEKAELSELETKQELSSLKEVAKENAYKDYNKINSSNEEQIEFRRNKYNKGKIFFLSDLPTIWKNTYCELLDFGLISKQCFISNLVEFLKSIKELKVTKVNREWNQTVKIQSVQMNFCNLDEHEWPNDMHFPSIESNCDYIIELNDNCDDDANDEYEEYCYAYNSKNGIDFLNKNWKIRIPNIPKFYLRSFQNKIRENIERNHLKSLPNDNYLNNKKNIIDSNIQYMKPDHMNCHDKTTISLLNKISQHFSNNRGSFHSINSALSRNDINNIGDVDTSNISETVQFPPHSPPISPSIVVSGSYYPQSLDCFGKLICSRRNNEHKNHMKNGVSTCDNKDHSAVLNQLCKLASYYTTYGNNWSINDSSVSQLMENKYSQVMPLMTSSSADANDNEHHCTVKKNPILFNNYNEENEIYRNSKIGTNVNSIINCSMAGNIVNVKQLEDTINNNCNAYETISKSDLCMMVFQLIVVNCEKQKRKWLNGEDLIELEEEEVFSQKRYHDGNIFLNDELRRISSSASSNNSSMKSSSSKNYEMEEIKELDRYREIHEIDLSNEVETFNMNRTNDTFEKLDRRRRKKKEKKEKKRRKKAKLREMNKLLNHYNGSGSNMEFDVNNPNGKSNYCNNKPIYRNILYDKYSNETVEAMRQEYRTRNIGMLVSSIKTEWQKRFIHRKSLNFYMNLFGIKKMKFLLLEIPNIIITGNGGYMRASTTFHAKEFCGIYLPKHLVSSILKPDELESPMISNVEHWVNDSGIIGILQNTETHYVTETENSNKLKPNFNNDDKYHKLTNIDRQYNRDINASLRQQSFRYLVNRLLYSLIAKVCQEQHAKYLLLQTNDLGNYFGILEKLPCIEEITIKDENIDVIQTDASTSENGEDYYFVHPKVSYQQFINDKHAAELAQNGVVGLQMCDIKSEWFKMYKCKISSFMRKAGYDTLGQFVENVPNVHVVGSGFKARCIVTFPESSLRRNNESSNTINPIMTMSDIGNSELKSIRADTIGNGEFSSVITNHGDETYAPDISYDRHNAKSTSQHFDRHSTINMINNTGNNQVNESQDMHDLGMINMNRQSAIIESLKIIQQASAVQIAALNTLVNAYVPNGNKQIIYDSIRTYNICNALIGLLNNNSNRNINNSNNNSDNNGNNNNSNNNNINNINCSNNCNYISKSNYIDNINGKHSSYNNHNNNNSNNSNNNDRNNNYNVKYNNHRYYDKNDLNYCKVQDIYKNNISVNYGRNTKLIPNSSYPSTRNKITTKSIMNGKWRFPSANNIVKNNDTCKDKSTYTNTIATPSLSLHNINTELLNLSGNAELLKKHQLLSTGSIFYGNDCNTMWYNAKQGNRDYQKVYRKSGIDTNGIEGKVLNRTGNRGTVTHADGISPWRKETPLQRFGKSKNNVGIQKQGCSRMLDWKGFIEIPNSGIFLNCESNGENVYRPIENYRSHGTMAQYPTLNISQPAITVNPPINANSVMSTMYFCTSNNSGSNNNGSSDNCVNGLDYHNVDNCSNSNNCKINVSASISNGYNGNMHFNHNHGYISNSNNDRNNYHSYTSNSISNTIFINSCCSSSNKINNIMDINDTTNDNLSNNNCDNWSTIQSISSNTSCSATGGTVTAAATSIDSLRGGFRERINVDVGIPHLAQMAPHFIPSNNLINPINLSLKPRGGNWWVNNMMGSNSSLSSSYKNNGIRFRKKRWPLSM